VWDLIVERVFILVVVQSLEYAERKRPNTFFLMRAQLDHLTGKISELEIRSQTYS